MRKSLSSLISVLMVWIGLFLTNCASTPLVDRAVSLREAGEYDQAVVVHQEAIKKNPNSAKAHSTLGYTYYKMRMMDEALDELNKAIELDSDYIPAYEDLGRVQLHLEQYPEYVSTYENLVSLEPNELEYRKKLARGYYLSEEFTKSIETYQSVLAKEDDDLSRWRLGFSVGLAHVRLGNQEEALNIYQESYQLGTENVYGTPYSAAKDLKDLIRDDIMTEEASLILKDVFGFHDIASLSPRKSTLGDDKRLVNAEDNLVTPFYALAIKPEVLYRQPAKYPQLAKKAGLEGTVVVKVLVNTTGIVEAVEVLKDVNPWFNEAAIEAARQFKFTPGATEKGLVKVWMAIPFTFRLK